MRHATQDANSVVELAQTESGLSAQRPPRSTSKRQQPQAATISSRRALTHRHRTEAAQATAGTVPRAAELQSPLVTR